MSKPNKDQLDKINRFARVELTEDEVVVFPNLMIDNSVTSYNTIIHENLLRKFSVDVKKGIGLLLGHNHETLPIGRSYDARLVEEWNADTGEALKCLYGDFYIALGRNTESGMTTDDIVKGIDSGTIFDTSIGFKANSIKCNICGEDVRSWRCEHWLGKDYVIENDNGEKEIKTCYGIVGENGEGELLENSLVYAGACSSATITNEYSEGSDTINKNKPRLHVVEQLKQIPEDANLYQFYTSNGCVFMTDTVPVDNSNTVEEKRSEEAMENYKAVFSQYGIDSEEALKAKLEDLTKLQVKLETKEQELSVKLSENEKLSNKVTELEGQLSEKETNITSLTDEVTKLTDNVKSLEADAALAETYKEDLRNSVTEMGIRSLGNSFNKELFEKFTVTLSVDELKELKEGLSEEVKQKFSGAKTTVTKIPASKADNSELYREDFETDGEYRDYIADKAKAYAEEKDVSLAQATKQLYSQYLEREDA